MAVGEYAPKIKATVVDDSTIEFLSNALPAIYRQGGLSKGFIEVSAKIKQAKLVLYSQLVRDQAYGKKIQKLCES